MDRIRRVDEIAEAWGAAGRFRTRLSVSNLRQAPIHTLYHRGAGWENRGGRRFLTSSTAQRGSGGECSTSYVPAQSRTKKAETPRGMLPKTRPGKERCGYFYPGRWGAGSPFPRIGVGRLRAARALVGQDVV